MQERTLLNHPKTKPGIKYLILLSNKLSNLNCLYIESGTHNKKEHFFAKGIPTTQEKFRVCTLWELSPTLQESAQGESVDVSVDQGYQTGR